MNSVPIRPAVSLKVGMRPRHKIALPASGMVEGPEAWDRFTKTMKQVLSVPHSEIKKRVEEHRAEAAKNPNRRGPKRKVSPSAFPGAGV
jgi:hypothetical protein